MKTLGFYNGNYGPLDEMMIPMNDRVCYFGDGVYDATLARNYKIFAIDEHIDRFYRSAALLKIDITYTKEQLKKLLNKMVQKVDTGDLFVYWQVTRGTASRNHAFPNVPSNLWIMLKPAGLKDPSIKIKLTEMEDTRFYHCNIKTLNLIPSVMASQKAEELGCQETIFHRGERVTECAHSNIHILKNGTLITAPTDELILPGIARAHLIKMCNKVGIPVSETPYTMTDLMNADEVIVTSSSQLCLTACEVDGVAVGGKAPELIALLQKELYTEFYEETAAE